MRPPTDLIVVLNRTRYNTATATLLAGDDYFDGKNFERRGTNTFLYRSPKGAFFVVRLSQWEGAKSPDLEPLDLEAAVALYDSLREARVPFEEAFPGVTVADA